MNVDELRQDFPLLEERPDQKPSSILIPPARACAQAVIAAMNEYYVRFPACSGRSYHRLGAEVTQKCDEARRQLAQFLGAARKEEIIFTRNTTEGINLVAHSLGLQRGDAVLITGKEHNSNLIPWQMLVKSSGIQLKVLPPKADGTFDWEGFEQALDANVRLVSFGYASNLDGVTLPVEQIIKQAHKCGSLVLLDAAQAALTGGSTSTPWMLIFWRSPVTRCWVHQEQVCFMEKPGCSKSFPLSW